MAASMAMAHRDPAVNDFAGRDYENPVAWHRKRKLPRERLINMNNAVRKSVILEQFGCRRDQQPEYIKWQLFGHDLSLCYEFVSNGTTDEALEIIRHMENMLESVGNNDPFLKSIKTAMGHVIYSTKNHALLQLNPLETKLENFAMPIKMDSINSAGLFGIQALFLQYFYGSICAKESKDCLRDAISLNRHESEWYFLIAKICHEGTMNGIQKNYVYSCQEEFEKCTKAVEIGGKVHHKLHLVDSYFRMSKISTNKRFKNEYEDARLRLINEAMDMTNDCRLFKLCLKNISNISNMKTRSTIAKLIGKLGSSDCPYVQSAIGKYYLHTVQDYEKALFYLNKVLGTTNFFGIFDYIYALYKIDARTAPVEQMLKDMLKKFTSIEQERILSQIVSYLLITKDDVVRSLKYIPMLLTMKSASSVYNLQNHKLQVHGYYTINLLDVISEKLGSYLNDKNMTSDNYKKVVEVVSIVEDYKYYVSNLMIQTNKREKGNVNTVKENWRTSKPDKKYNS